MLVQIFITISIMISYGVWFMVNLLMTGQNSTHTLTSLTVGSVSLVAPLVICLIVYLLDFHLWGLKPLYSLLFFTFITFSFVTEPRSFPKLLVNHFRGISNEGYFKKDKVVYFNGQKIDMDAESFEVVPNGGESIIYAKDKTSVFYRFTKIEGANPKNFRMVSKSKTRALFDYSIYMTDDQSIYVYDKVTELFDAKTFRQLVTKEGLATCFYADRKNVYFDDKIIPELNPQLAQPLNEVYISDGTKVSYFYDIISDIDAPSARLPPDIKGRSREILMDDKKVFRSGEEIKGLSAKEAVFLPEGYVKDSQLVYYFSPIYKNVSVILEGANLKSFKSYPYDKATNSDAFDGQNYFLKGEKIN
jgi:hypothetical protein